MTFAAKDAGGKNPVAVIAKMANSERCNDLMIFTPERQQPHEEITCHLAVPEGIID